MSRSRFKRAKKAQIPQDDLAYLDSTKDSILNKKPKSSSLISEISFSLKQSGTESRWDGWKVAIVKLNISMILSYRELIHWREFGSTALL